MLKTILKTGIVAALIGMGIAASWAMVDTGIHMTSDDEFCSGCHSHQPIGSSYRASLHGGNNAKGWRASCSQCHISHESSLHYLWVKGIHGVVDPVMELLQVQRIMGLYPGAALCLRPASSVFPNKMLQARLLSSEGVTARRCIFCEQAKPEDRNSRIELCRHLTSRIKRHQGIKPSSVYATRDRNTSVWNWPLGGEACETSRLSPRIRPHRQYRRVPECH